jgi:hypothetical protein
MKIFLRCYLYLGSESTFQPSLLPGLSFGEQNVKICLGIGLFPAEQLGSLKFARKGPQMALAPNFFFLASINLDCFCIVWAVGASLNAAKAPPPS